MARASESTPRYASDHEVPLSAPAPSAALTYRTTAREGEQASRTATSARIVRRGRWFSDIFNGSSSVHKSAVRAPPFDGGCACVASGGRGWAGGRGESIHADLRSDTESRRH